MTAVAKDFTVSRNADWEYDFQFVATVDNVPNQPVDMTGAELRMDVARVTGEKQLRLREGDGIEWIDQGIGKARIFVPRARVFGLPAGDYVHDLLIVRGPLITRYWAGQITVEHGVTDV